MVWKRWAFCRDPTFNSDFSPGRVTCGAILCPDGGQLPVSHMVARANNRHTHHHYRLKTAAVFTFSAPTINYVSYPQSKTHMTHLALVSPTVAQMAQNPPEMLVWDELAQPQLRRVFWARLRQVGQVDHMHFWLRVFSTYDGFIRMEPHCKLRKSCYYQITYHQARCNTARDLTCGYSWEAPQWGQLRFSIYSTERRDAYPKSAGWWGSDARGTCRALDPTMPGHALQWCHKGRGWIGQACNRLVSPHAESRRRARHNSKWPSSPKPHGIHFGVLCLWSPSLMGGWFSVSGGASSSDIFKSYLKNCVG